jgi:YD repeat-containing protein
MKTTYKLISFLSHGLLLIIVGAWSQNTYGEGRNLSLLISNNNMYSTNCNDYGMLSLSYNSSENIIFRGNGIYNAEGIVALSQQSKNLTVGGKKLALGNNLPGYNTSIDETTKGGYSGCTIYKYQYKSGVLLPDTKIKYNLYLYNNKGDPTEYIYFDLVSSKSNRETFKYNDGGNLTEQTTYFKNGAICDKTTYKYDISGNLIEAVWYESGYKLLNRETYRYDKQNKVVEEVHYFGSDVIVGKDLYMYNETGKVTEHKGLNSEGNVRDLDTYSYDAKNCLIEKKMQSNEPLVLRTFIYKYNDQGNLIQESEVKANKCTVIKAIYNYDLKGIMISHLVLDNNYIVKDTYDQIGNKIETMITYKGVLNSKVVFTYDAYSNLTSETQYNGQNQPYELTDYVFF